MGSHTHQQQFDVQDGAGEVSKKDLMAAMSTLGTGKQMLLEIEVERGQQLGGRWSGAC